FGATSSGAGIGWYISMRRNFMDVPGVFASLIVIIIIGLVIEYGIFYWVEKFTVRKWGMSS
ncbi:MAG: ABC transporter permease, partial [Lachnospiraceae bacterium]|nr:ABC transporter permease [Lachnospiraceae bacterium]